MNLVAAFEYIKFGLKLAEGSVELVHPELLKVFMEILLKKELMKQHQSWTLQK
jgi:hypothetical protein